MSDFIGVHSTCNDALSSSKHRDAHPCTCSKMCMRTGVKYWNLRLLTNFDELHSVEPSIRVQVRVVLGYG